MFFFFRFGSYAVWYYIPLNKNSAESGEQKSDSRSLNAKQSVLPFDSQVPSGYPALRGIQRKSNKNNINRSWK